MRHTIITLCLLSICGCSSWQRATSSQQWIELPPPAHATTDVMRAEWTLVQQGTALTNNQQIADLAARGIIRAWGPADISRELQYDPQTDAVKLTITSKNSDWLGGMFRGLWSSASALGDWIATAAAGAKP